MGIDICRSDLHVLSAPGKPAEVEMRAQRILLRPVTKADLEDYHKYLFGSPVVMAKYGKGEVKSLCEVENRIKTWTARWEKGDPFSGLCIRDKETGEFIGHVILGHSDVPGTAELAILIRPEYWNQKYGTEALRSVFAYAREILYYPLDGAPFTKIEATARVDNVASNRLLTAFAGAPVAQQYKHGALRNLYKVDLSEARQTAASQHFKKTAA